MGSKSIQYFAAAGKNLWPHLVIGLRPFWHVYDPICSTLEDDDHPSCLSFFPFISTYWYRSAMFGQLESWFFLAGEASFKKVKPFWDETLFSDLPTLRLSLLQCYYIPIIMAARKGNHFCEEMPIFFKSFWYYKFHCKNDYRAREKKPYCHCWYDHGGYSFPWNGFSIFSLVLSLYVHLLGQGVLLPLK